VKGTILGKITVGGTLGTPTADLKLALSQLVSARRIPGKPAPKPTDLTIEARWGGASGNVTISGKSGEGMLSAVANGQPTDRAKITASLTATSFDLTPIAAFLPGTLAALEGTLGGSLTVRGFDSAGKLRGSLAIAGAVVPLHPMLGTLREGTALAKIDDRGLQLDLAGKLGAGKLQLTATSAGHDLAAIEARGTVDDVSPLGEWEPMIDAKVVASFRRASREQWRGTIKIREASAVLPESGSDLGDPDKPSDLLFVEDGDIVLPAFAFGGRPPERPWLVADLDLEPMKVRAEDLFDTRGEVSAKLELSVGESIGLVGHVDIVNGIIGDLFGRRYTASGDVTFDGTLEPKVDITLQHKFTELTLFVKLFGNPATLRPAFSADSGTYTPDQLAGFFLGGEPGGDPSTQTREAATGASVAVVSSVLSTRIRKRLPIKLEQLGCDLGNSVSTASCTAGKWFGEKLFVAFKRRIDARLNENVNEGQGQYYLRRDVYVEVVGGDAGSGGVDLLWRRRW
jgi:autotransporter translocation and assembly factor TamB